MPDALVFQAMKKLPVWMVEVSERFDEVVNQQSSQALWKNFSRQSVCESDFFCIFVG